MQKYKTVIDKILRWKIGRKLCTCINNAVIIVGAGRSGTTVICEMLDRHSKILISRGEGPLVSGFGKLAYEYNFGKKTNYYQNNTGIKNKSFRNLLRQSCFCCVWGDWHWTGLIPSQTKLKNVHSSSQKPFTVWGVKAFPDKRSAEGLEWLYSNAKFIYIYRNGLEVVHSMSKFPAFSSMSFETRCQFWSDRAFRYQYLQENERAVSVRFEDFVAQPEKVCHQIFSHLNLESEKLPINFTTTTIIHPQDQPTQSGNPRLFFAQREPAYVFWSKDERISFKKICARAMDLLEYEIPF